MGLTKAMLRNSDGQLSYW